jgi:hypothetical protein
MLTTAIGELIEKRNGTKGANVQGCRKMYIYELHALCSSADSIREIQ